MKKRKEQKELSTIMTRRMLMLGAGQGVLGALLVGRLYQLQIAQSEGYRRLSDNNQFDRRLVLAPRGRILDRKGRLLAGNSEVFELRMLPSRISNHQAWLKRVSRLITLKPEDIETILGKIAEQPKFLEVTVKSNLTQRELSRLAVLSPVLEGASFQKSYKRIYPQGWMTAHVTGYVSPVNKRDIDGEPDLRYLPETRIGRTGIEHNMEPDLRGLFGFERVEVNARGKPVRVLRDQQANPGEDAYLSLDAKAQFFATDRLRRGRWQAVPVQMPEVQEALLKNKELRAHVSMGDDLVLKDEKGRLIPPESGSVVVMDIETGEIKVMVSTPSFDPNLFSNRLSVRDWQRMNEHPRTPLLNRAISGLYPPGSTFKMVVLAAALEAGVISQKTRIDCSGAFEFGGQNFHCWLERGHGLVNAEQSIERSCDVYFYQIALKTGINRIHDMARRLGLGDVSALGLISEKEGIIPNRDWKLEKRGVVWTPGETVVAGIGQGFVLTTPLQLALMTARIANGRSAITPSLVTQQSPERRTERRTEKRTEKSAVFPPLDVSPDIIRFLHKSMRKVMAGGLGTARKHDIDQGMAGKTGTVQVKRITKEQREKGIIDNIDRPWKERDHALFVAFAPYEKPRYAISVIVEHGGSGSSAAAPIARDIMDFMLKSDGMSA